MTANVEIRIAGGIAVLTFGEPPLNLVTRELTRELGSELDRLREDEATRVLVVRGAGERAFCGGSDIKEFPSMMFPGGVIEHKLRLENEVYSKLAHFPKPTIAAVRGLALGGGLELAVCCDVIVVEDDARLGLPEIKLGIFPGSGGTVRVMRRIGPARARRMILFGEPIPPQTALDWGLIDHIVPKGRAMDEALRCAAIVAERPGAALQFAKAALAAAESSPEAAAIEAAMHWIDRAFCTADVKEGVAAFMEKREARFVHR